MANLVIDIGNTLTKIAVFRQDELLRAEHYLAVETGALLHNTNRKFNSSNIHLLAQTSNSLLTSVIDPQRALKIPIAHGEGNYFADVDVLKSINDNNQVLFRYCDESGNITAESNPNGSIENIAGVCNTGRNVFGIMPHPERASDSLLANQDGLAIFESILSLVKA